MTDDEFAMMLRVTRREISRMDKTDRKSGFAAPVDCGGLTFIRTIMGAIECAFKTEEPQFFAQAYVMLEQLVERIESIDKSAALN